MEGYIMFLDWNIQCCNDVTSYFDLWIQWNRQSESQLASFKFQTEMHTFVCQKSDMDTFSTVIHNSLKWKQSECPSMTESKISCIFIQAIVDNNGNEQITVQCNHTDKSH